MPEGNPDGLAVLEKRFADLPARVRYVANADEATIRSIDRGVLFFMAFWSVTSYQSLRSLIQTLSERDEATFELIIVDVDGSEPLYALAEFQAFRTVFGGNGETAWLHGGNVIATTFGAYDRRNDYRMNLDLLASFE